jgi:ribonuclease D
MSIYRSTISKEEVADLPLADFEGQIHVVQTLKEVEKAVSFLKKHPVLGFDTESRPAFKKGKLNNVALIQLSTDSSCFLFRINLTGVPQSLSDLLANPSIKKIGLAIKDDFHSLNKIMTVQQANFIELQNYVKDFLIEENSLAKIYAILFQKRISKSQRLSNWEADFLTERQKQYAALDAWATREIYMKLESLNDSK